MKVSIICTVYNKGDYVAEAIESFLAQKVSFPYEILVVDDGSSDGSRAVIEAYAAQYPDVIRAFYHEKNWGIAKTWIDICTHARGQYIARCDGDDYWTSDTKLQKQVDLLDNTPGARWSNTDFDMVDPTGKLLFEDVLKNEHVPVCDSFEKMLAFKGLTNASTWLVDTELMREVNASIDSEAADDTFDIQLELFKRTDLYTVWESLDAYRIGQESDSRSFDLDKHKKRLDGLSKAQKKYLEGRSPESLATICELLIDYSEDKEYEATRYAQQLGQKDAECRELQAKCDFYENSRRYQLVSKLPGKKVAATGVAAFAGMGLLGLLARKVR